jgi:indole-3-acetate monooxygenase
VLTTDVKSIDSLLRAHSDQHERDRRLAPAVVEALQSINGFRLFVPKAYDGPEHDPVDVMTAIAELAQADAASAWCATIGTLTSHCAGVMEPDVARAVFGDSKSIVCGAYAPNGVGTKQPNGWTVNGRWAWGSGSPFADWMTGGTITDDGNFHQMFFRREQLTIHDTWESSGLRGTGSHDFSAEQAFVSDGFSTQIGRATPTTDASIARMPLFPLFCSGIASVMVGIAWRALAEITELANAKKAAQATKTLAHSAIIQSDIARAEAIIRSSWAYLIDELSSAWEVVQNGDRVSTDLRIRSRLAASHVGGELCRAVDLCYHAGGGTAVYTLSPLQRCFRDVHTAAAHIMVSPRTFETVGRYRFGLNIDPIGI